MTPILFAPNRTSLLAHLADATVCEVAEERNGTYELYLEIPIASEQYTMIETDCWIQARPSEGSPDQFFRVYNVEKNMAGLAIVEAEHISYLLAAYPVDRVAPANRTATQAMNAVLTRAAQLLPAHHGFQAWSDVTATSNGFSATAGSARAALGGVQGSILQFYGGEYEFDNLTVRLHRARGRNSGVRIEYRKNLLGLKASISTERSFTGLFPFVRNDDSYVFLPEHVLWVDNRSGVQRRVMMRDFTHDLGDNPTVAQLRAAGQSFLSANDINVPSISMDVDFVHLWNSPEYAEFVDLERVALCDTITVYHPDMGVDVTTKVIRTVYDTLRERFVKITLGSAQSNMASVLTGIREEIAAIDVPEISGIQELINQAVDNATNAITGNSGGRVILHPARNPQELLILTDANDTIQTARRLWRWNAGGLGFATNGFNGTFRTAITADGQIVADFITTGTLTANVIRAGILTDAAGRFSLNMTTGAARLDNATLNNVTIAGGSLNVRNATGTRETTINATTGLSTNFITVTGGSINIRNATGTRETTINATTGLTTNFVTVTGGSINITGANDRVTRIDANGLTANNATLNTATIVGGSLTIRNANGTRETVINATTGLSTNNAVITGGSVEISAGTGTARRSARVASGEFTLTNSWGANVLRIAAVPATGTPVWATIRADLPLTLQSFSTRFDLDQNNAHLTTPGDIWLQAPRVHFVTSGLRCLVDQAGNIIAGSSFWANGGSLFVGSVDEIKESISAAPSMLEVIKGAEICRYNLKAGEHSGEHRAEQSYGFVIGEGHKTPKELIAETGKHIDLYSMTSMLWKGMQELIERTSKLEGANT